MSWSRQWKTAREVAEASPAYGAALRAATVTVLPLLYGEATGHLEFIWMGLGGWLSSFADPGGSYPARATSMSLFVIGGPTALLLGSLAGRHPLAAPALLLAAALVCSMVRVYGDAAATAGVLVLVSFCIGVGTPSAEPYARAGLMAAGGLLAMALALGLWAVHPYAPAREAVAACYRALAELARALGHGDPTVPLRKGVREALEKARATLSAVRSTRLGETARGSQLLVLFELAEAALGDLVALAELQPDDALLQVSSAFLTVAFAVPRENTRFEAPQLELIAARPAAARVITRARHSLEAAASLSGARTPRPIHLRRRPLLQPLRDALSPRSLHLRHALRLGVTLATAQVLADLLHLSRSHWITVAIVLVLQPYAGATVRRTLQRVAGTGLGAIVAAVLAALIHSQLAIGLLLFPLSMAAVAARPLNYALYSMLMTPVFILLAESTGGDWHLAPLRIFNNLLGGLLAFAASRLLWPSWERERMPLQLAALLRSDGAFARAALSQQDTAAARRGAGIEAVNAEAALQRFLDEPHDPARAEPLMALLAYSRRFTARLAAFAADDVQPLPVHAESLAAALEELARAAGASRKPGALAPLSLAGLDARQAGHIEALDRPLRVLASALDRFAP